MPLVVVLTCLEDGMCVTGVKPAVRLDVVHTPYRC